MGAVRVWLLGALCLVGAVMPVFVMWGHGGPGADHRVIWEAANIADPYSILFPYPPIVLPLLWPLRLFSFEASFWAFNLVTGAAFALAARPFTRYWPLALLTPGATMCVSYGQTGFLVGALWLFAFNKNAPAVAMLAIKPHLGFLSVLTLRDRGAWIVAFLTLGLVCLLPMIEYGPAIWGEWYARAKSFSAVAAEWEHWDYSSASLYVHWGFWPWIVGAGLAAYLLSRKFDVFTAATAALIISPYSFIYDTPVACLGIGLALLEERSPYKVAILSLALVSPSLIMFGAAWAPFALLAALWIQAGRSAI